MAGNKEKNEKDEPAEITDSLRSASRRGRRDANGDQAG